MYHINNTCKKTKMKKLAILFILCFFGQTAFSQTAPTYSKEYVVGQSTEIKNVFLVK